MSLVIVIGLAALFLGVHIWATREYLGFLQEHPEVERRLVERAHNQSY